MNDVPLDALPVPVLVELVRTLQAQVAALEAELATRRGGGPPTKTSANSSVPPVKTGKPAGPPSRRRPGGW